MRCPCCGGSGEIDGPPVQLTPLQRRIYDLVRARPHYLGSADLACQVYGDEPDGGSGSV
jgi:hypothetical protein